MLFTRYLVFASLTLPAFGACPVGFTEIQQTLRTPSGSLFAGTITAARKDATLVNGASVRPRPVTVTVTAGNLDWCLAGGNYAMSTDPGGITLSYWLVPPSGGPYTVTAIETAVAPPIALKILLSQIDPGNVADGTYCLQIAGKTVTGLAACSGGGSGGSQSWSALTSSAWSALTSSTWSALTQ